MKAILVLYYWISRVIYLLAMDLKSVNKFQTSVALRIETSHLICIANQMTGFYIKCNTDLRWVTQWYFTTSVVNGPFNLFPWRYLFIFVSFNIENLAWSNMKTNQYVHLLDAIVNLIHQIRQVSAMNHLRNLVLDKILSIFH